MGRAPVGAGTGVARARPPAGTRGTRAGAGVAEAGAGQLAAGSGAVGGVLLMRPEPGQPAPRPSRNRRSLSVIPASLREEWGGNLAEACWQWHQRGSARW